MPTVDILVLANARKHLGRCVAGLRRDDGQWTRLVSKSADGTLNWSQYLLDSGKDARVLDVISAGVKAPRPALHQPENVVIDGSVWKLSTKYAPTDAIPHLQKALLPGPELFGGCRDRVAWQEIEEKPTNASLALIAPERIDLVQFKKADGKHHVRGQFALTVGSRSGCYDLSLTDPHWEEIIKQKGPQILDQKKHKFLATVSLGEPFNGYCYKLLAAIIVLPPEIASAL
jgi:hypothetical protein